MQLIFNKVTRTIQYDKKQIYQLNLGADSAEVETIKSTANHPFYVKGEGFVRVDQLKQTDQLIDAYHNNRLVIQKIAKTNQFSEVNDLTVESSHTYFIGRAGAWVHNSCLQGENLQEVAKKTIDYVNDKIKYSATRESLSSNGVEFNAKEASMIRKYRRIIAKQANEQSLSDYIDKLANAAKHFSCGDCMEMSALGAQFLKENGFVGRISIMNIGHEDPKYGISHAFITITSEDKNIMVLDPCAREYYPYSELTSRMHTFKSEVVNQVIYGKLMPANEYELEVVINY